MNKNLYLLAFALCTLVTAWPSARAGDMKAELVADVKLFHSHFGKTPFPNKTITVHPHGIRFHLSPATKVPEYTALYSFFKVGGDFEISANYDWTPVDVPDGGYGVSCGIRIETNDKRHSLAIARGNFPGTGSAYRVTVGTMSADRSVEYKNEDPFPTKAKNGRLILARTKKEVICLAANKTEEPTELCRIPFTDAAVQRVLIFADPGSAPTHLDARVSQFRIQAEELSHHMTKKESQGGWLGVIAGAGGLLLVGTIGYVVVRRLRTGRWSGAAEAARPGRKS